MKYDAFTRDELISLIELRDKQISEKNRIIERQKAMIEHLSHNIELSDEIVNTRNNQIVELNNTIKDLTEKVINRDKRIQELEMTVNDVKAQRDALRNANCHSGRYPWGPKPPRLSDQINLIEKRLNEIENYIFGGNKND